MRRAKKSGGASLDSLLDTMTNVVGILVILLTVTQLGVGDALVVGDLEVPENVKILNEPDEKVALVRLLAVAAATEDEEAAEEAATAEPEVIGRTAEQDQEDSESKS